MSYTLLQDYWWILVSVLGSLLVFLLFVQGGQSFLFTFSKDPLEERMILNSTGRKWEFTFTTLVVFGGAFFASFPLFYSTSFSGAYWVWMLILFCFIVQAVSYEYFNKKGNVFGSKMFRTFLFLNGVLAPILLGAAVSTFFMGANFEVNKDNIIDINATSHVISSWLPYNGIQLHGLEAVLDIRNVIFGLAVFFLSRISGLLYFINNINDDALHKKIKKHLWINTIIFLVFFLTYVVCLLLADGFAYNPETNEVVRESYKYLHNFLSMPAVLGLFLVGVLLVLYGIGSTLFKPGFKKGIWFEGVGVVLTALSLFFLAGFNNTAYYPSFGHLQSSLTIRNSSSSPFTLKVMSIVSILIPFVLAYMVYAWRSLDIKKITREEIKSDDHAY